jgi:hypothetical protein
MREMVLAYEPGLDDHRRTTQLTEAFARFERRSWILNRGDVDPLSRCFPYGNEWHGSCSPPYEATRSVLSLFFCPGGLHHRYQQHAHWFILIDPEKSGNAYPHTFDVPSYYGISEEIRPASKEMALHSSVFDRKTAWAGQRKGICTAVIASDLPKSDLNAYCIKTTTRNKVQFESTQKLRFIVFLIKVAVCIHWRAGPPQPR